MTRLSLLLALSTLLLPPVFSQEAKEAKPDTVECSLRFLRRQIVAGAVTPTDLAYLWKHVIGKQPLGKMYMGQERIDGELEDKYVFPTAAQRRTVEQLKPLLTPGDMYDRTAAGDAQPKAPNLSPGDLIVYWLPWEEEHAVFVVRKFYPAALRADVVFYSTKEKRITVMDRWGLSVAPEDAKIRHLRPGLMYFTPNKEKWCDFASREQKGSK